MKIQAIKINKNIAYKYAIYENETYRNETY